MSDVEARLCALRAAGGEAFDDLGFGFIVALVSRAGALDGGARDRLLERARARIDALDAALAEARAAVERELTAFAAEGAAVAPELQEALARGEVARVRREIRSALRQRIRDRQMVQVPWLARLRSEALSRGAQLPDEVRRDLAGVSAEDLSIERRAHGRAVAAGDALSLTLFRESAERARATLAVARAVDNVPEAAGPYNAQVLTARTLTAMAELAPAYVCAVVAAADDLAALEALLAPEAEASKGKAKAGKRRRTQAPPPKAP